MDQLFGSQGNKEHLGASPEDNIHQVISLIYQTASDPERWPELLHGLAEFVENSASTPANQTGSKSEPGEEYSLHQGLQQVQQFNTGKAIDAESDHVATLLTYHFRNALDIAQRLMQQEEYQEVIHDVINHLPVGVIIINAQRQIINANGNARKYIEYNNELVIDNEQLGAVSRDSMARLDRIVRDLSQRAPTVGNENLEIFPVKDANQNELLMFLMPARGGLSTDGYSNIIIFLSHPKSLPLVIPREIKQAFELTNREAKVLCSIARGLTTREIAIQDSVSEETVRSQLKSLFAKTGTSRQPELVKLVFNSPGVTLEHGNNSLPSIVNRGKGGMQLPQENEIKIIQLPGGRRLSYQEYGKPGGRPFIFLHSILGSHLETKLIAHQACVKHGIRLIAPNRPGFSHSDPHPERTMLSDADDLKELADQLGLDKFYLAGQTMGGPFACAMAIRMPQRVKKMLLISTGLVAQTHDEFDEMTQMYRFGMRLARDFPSGYRLVFNLIIKGILKNRDKFIKNLTRDLVEEETRLLKSENFSQKLFEVVNEGHKQGGYHTGRDVLLSVRDWGFDPANITVPTQVWHGTEDRHVPSLLGKKLAEHIPGSEFIPVPGAGHFMVYNNFSQILKQFLADE